MNYGDKRSYPKIDIFIDGKYWQSTTWAKACKEARKRVIDKFIFLNKNVIARKAKV